MKKRLLLFAAVLSASANFVFAETKTVQDSNGNTYSYDTKNDLDASSYGGDTLFANTASIDLNNGQLKLKLNSDQRIKISNCNLKYNVKLTNVSANPGTIAPFTQYLTEKGTVYDVVVQESQIVNRIKEGRKTVSYSIKQGDAYNRYLIACERAKVIQADLIYKGDALINGDWLNEQILKDDVGGLGQGADINPDLYYMISQGENVYPITNVDGDYAVGTTYSNAMVTYTPVGIADGAASYTVDGTGKVGYVHGVVDNGQVADIFANANYNKYLNFDFSDASVLGTISTNITDNRIAYFNEGVTVAAGDNKGQNIIVNSQCKKYVISDNGQEIYVAKSFQAMASQYKRTIAAETYGTIVLPFTVENTGNVFVKQARLTGYTPSPENESLTTNKLTFTSSDVMAPNTPYLFKSLSTVTGESIFEGNVNGTVNATGNATSSKFNGAQFVGTFEGLSAQDASQVYVIGVVNGVGKIGRTSKALKPGRCYLTYDASTNAKVENATIEIIDEDGSVETVSLDEEVTAIEGVVNGEAVSVQYISVDGQISNEPFSGINLVKKTFEDGSVETIKVVF